MKHSILAIIIYLGCLALIFWAVSDLNKMGEDWYITGFVWWRIIGAIIIGIVTYIGSVRSWKKKGLK